MRKRYNSVPDMLRGLGANELASEVEQESEKRRRSLPFRLWIWRLKIKKELEFALEHWDARHWTLAIGLVLVIVLYILVLFVV